MISFFKKQWQLMGWLFLFVLLRIPLLDGSFWLDEAAQALESIRPWSQQLQLVEDFQPPLLHLWLHLAAYGSHSEWWLRTWGALIPAMISIWAGWQLMLHLFSSHPRKTWLASMVTALLVTNSFHIFYSQELRPYALPLMWAVLSWLYLAKWADHKRWPWGAAFTLTTIGGLYSSYLYPFLVAGQIGWWAVTQPRQRWQSLLSSLLTSAISFLPWLPFFFGQLAQGQQVRTDLPGWEAVVSLPQLKALPLVLGKFVFGVVNLELNAGFGFVTVVLAALAGAAVWPMISTQKITKQQQRALFLFVAWFLIPLLTSWIVSFWVPVVRPKRVLLLLPALYGLIIAVGLSSNTKKVLTPAGWGLFGLLLAINVWSTQQYWSQPKLQRENWRSLHAQIIRQYPASQSAVIFSAPGPFAPWRWYDNGDFPTLNTGALHVADADLKELSKAATEYRYVLVFDYLRDLSDPEDEILQQLKEVGFQESALLDRPNIGFVRVYAIPETLQALQR